MLVVMNSNAAEIDIQRVALFLESKGFEARISHGEARTIVHAIGLIDVDERDFELLSGVSEVIKVTTNYKLAARIAQGKENARKYLKEHTVVCQDIFKKIREAEFGK